MDELLPHSDDSLIKIEKEPVDYIEDYDHYDNITRTYLDSRADHRKLLYAWLNKQKGTSILIKGIKKDGELFEKVFMDTIVNLNISEPLKELDLDPLVLCR